MEVQYEKRKIYYKQKIYRQFAFKKHYDVWCCYFSCSSAYVYAA